MSAERVELPDGIEAGYIDGELELEGEGGSVSRELEHPLIEVEVEDGSVVFRPLDDKRDVESVAGTFRGHLENMVEGLQEEHVYTMKAVYAHFPMSLDVQGDELHIENFMGERADRVVRIDDGVDVSVDGEELTLRGADREAVSQTAARIEQACHKGDRDPRTFQDGVYITGGDSA